MAEVRENKWHSDSVPGAASPYFTMKSLTPKDHLQDTQAIARSPTSFPAEVRPERPQRQDDRLCLPSRARSPVLDPGNIDFAERPGRKRLPDSCDVPALHPVRGADEEAIIATKNESHATSNGAGNGGFRSVAPTGRRTIRTSWLPRYDGQAFLLNPLRRWPPRREHEHPEVIQYCSESRSHSGQAPYQSRFCCRWRWLCLPVLCLPQKDSVQALESRARSLRSCLLTNR